MSVELPRRALVVGLARSGQAAALALARRDVEVVAADCASGLDTGSLAEAGVDVHLGTDAESLLDGVELVVKSPGVPGETPLVAAARRSAIPVWSEVELGYRLFGDNPVLAVTGTNGKTTTSELLGAMLDTTVAGNVGRALCDLDGELAADQWIVCEVSSFQLEDIVEFRPKVAVLVNLEPDHLDRHASLDEYRRAKLRVFENQSGSDSAIVPRGFGQVPGEGSRVEFSADDPLPAEPRIPGAHNRENAAAASAAARAVGLDDHAIAAALETFPGVEHRLELVAEVNGVRYVNDSKATNTAAARRAVAAYDAPLLVILGGLGKGESYSELALLLKERAKRVYVIGAAADEIGIALELAGVDHQRVGDLERAVGAAAAVSRPGDVVLLAPACASYDQFRDFEERGEAFKRLVANITG
jgi:UDP-N-acetylmuramoylalanine--D-glutamate ligase